jgi:hypothetical protein
MVRVQTFSTYFFLALQAEKNEILFMLHATLWFIRFINFFSGFEKRTLYLSLFLKFNIFTKSQVDIIQIDQVVIVVFVLFLLIATSDDGWLRIRHLTPVHFLVHLSLICFWWVSRCNTLSLNCILLRLSTVVTCIKSIDDCRIICYFVVKYVHVLLLVPISILEFVHANTVKSESLCVLEVSSLILFLLK